MFENGWIPKQGGPPQQAFHVDDIVETLENLLTNRSKNVKAHCTILDLAKVFDNNIDHQIYY